MSDAEQMVKVYSVTSAELAEIIRVALEDEGIRCAIGNEHQAGLTGMGDLLSVDIFVPEHEAARAHKLIESHIS